MPETVENTTFNGSATNGPLVWDKEGQRFYETGVKNVAIYIKNEAGTYQYPIAWNGVTSISESPSGAEATPLYADDIKYLNLISTEELGISIEAYTYPNGFEYCDGSRQIAPGLFIGQQSRREFAIAYKTTLGNDVKSNDYGYKLHIIYNVLISPSERAYASINESPEAITFSWEGTTTPVITEGYKATSIVTIDSSKIDKDKLKTLEEKLFGKDTTPGELMMPAEIIAHFNAQG